MANLMVLGGATIVAVSDSRGAVTRPNGFTRQELAAVIAHKNAGKRFDTLLASPVVRMLSHGQGPLLAYDPNPETLQQVEADLLVLTAIPDSIRSSNAPKLRVRVVCELTGAAVSADAKRILKERGIEVIPDNLGSSGGLLVSLSEMLQNSTGQFWDRRIEEENLRCQISRSYEDAWTTAHEHNVDVATASDILAMRRMHDLAVYRERLGGSSETSLAVNLGGGAKIRLLGPLRLRLDYRLFSLRGDPLHDRYHRLYAGANLGF